MDKQQKNLYFTWLLQTIPCILAFAQLLDNALALQAHQRVGHPFHALDAAGLHGLPLGEGLGLRKGELAHRGGCLDSVARARFLHDLPDFLIALGDACELLGFDERGGDLADGAMGDHAVERRGGLCSWCDRLSSCCSLLEDCGLIMFDKKAVVIC